MKTYTHEDWLKDKIDFKSDLLIKRDDGSYSLYHENELGDKKLPEANKILPEKEYNKIRELQEEAFNASFTMAFESYKKFFLDEISKADYPYEYLKKQQDEHKKDIDKFPENAHNSRMLDGVILGTKAFTKIKGSQYFEIKAAWEGFKNGKIKYVTYYLNDYLGMYTTYRIYKWLEKYTIKEQSENRTKKKIENAFETLDQLGWEYAFNNEKDYNLFVELLANFFENKHYKILPPIKLKRRTKTKIATVFNSIHKELSNCDKLKEDIEYFKIIRVLNHFKNLSDNDIYKHITR